MTGLDDTLKTLKAHQRPPTEQIARGALGIRGLWDLMLLKDFQNKFRIDAAEQKAAAKIRQPEMEDVELMATDEEMRIGDEYHINYSEPAKPQPAASASTNAEPKSSTLGTLGSMAAGAAILASGAGLAQVPALLNSTPSPAATAPTDPAIDTDTITDVEIRGGIEEAK